MYIVIIADSSYERAWNILQAKLHGRKYDNQTESDGDGLKVIPKPITSRSARKISRAAAEASLLMRATAAVQQQNANGGIFNV